MSVTEPTTAQAAPILPDLANVRIIELAELLPSIQAYADKNARFITATSIDSIDRFEIYYHFDVDLKMEHLHLTIDKDTEVPSISGIYLAAFLIENEMKELFGVKVTNIAIDYKGHLYLTEDSDPTPMAKEQPKPSAT